MTTPTTGPNTPTTVVTADQLNTLYTHSSQLHHNGAALDAARRRVARHRNRTHAVTITALVGIAALTAANIITHHIGTITGLSTALIGTLTHLTHRRHQRHLTEQRADNATAHNINNNTWDTIHNSFQHTTAHNPLHNPNPAAWAQAAEILGTRGYPFDEHPATTQRRAALLHTAITHLALPGAPDGADRQPLTHTVGDRRLLLIGRWKPLAHNIAHHITHGTDNTAANAGAHLHRTVGDTLQQLTDNHDHTVLTLANQLAADDPNCNHHWTELVDIATTLTPQPV
jgi:hypothetical protein